MEDACPECSLSVRATLEAKHGLLPESSLAKCAKCQYPLAGRFTRHTCPNCQLLISESVTTIPSKQLSVWERRATIVYAVVWLLLVKRSWWDAFVFEIFKPLASGFELGLAFVFVVLAVVVWGIVLGCLLLDKRRWVGIATYLSVFVLIFASIFG